MAGSVAQIRTPRDIKNLGTILSIWAHPDDETYWSGALMATAVKNLQTVICVTATKGEEGCQDTEKWPAGKMADIRAAEMRKAMKELGVVRHHWLGYRDGHCAKAPMLEVMNRLTALLERYHPATILTFPPDGITGSPDHQAVSLWIRLVLDYTSFRPRVYHAALLSSAYDRHLRAADEQLDIFYNVDEPVVCEPSACDIYFAARPDVLQQKYRALEAMPSQTTGMLELFPMDKMIDAFGVEAFRRAL
jgi:LmbE family N-acetylglucosaminyl deacetylase